MVGRAGIGLVVAAIPVVCVRDCIIVNAGNRVVLYRNAGIAMINERVRHRDVHVHPHRHPFVDHIVEQATVDQDTPRILGAGFAHIQRVGIGQQSAADRDFANIRTGLSGIEVDAVTAKALIFH